MAAIDLLVMDSLTEDIITHFKEVFIAMLDDADNENFIDAVDKPLTWPCLKFSKMSSL